MIDFWFYPFEEEEFNCVGFSQFKFTLVHCQPQNNNLSIKRRLLVCHVEISQITTPVVGSWNGWKALRKVGVYQVGFIISQPPRVEKLSQIDEIYFQKTFNQTFLILFIKSSCFYTLFKQLTKIQKYFNNFLLS
jgi:hypothetical protein